MSNRRSVIVINNDDPHSDYGARHLAKAFAGPFDPEIVSPLGGLAPVRRRIAGGEAGALVLSGSDRSITEGLPWMLEEEELLREAVVARLPVLAICFGHQLLGEAFGAGVLTREKRIGLFEATLLEHDPAFDGVVGTAIVPEQHADQLASVPKGFRLLATSEYCPVQAIRHAEAPAYGMQFHPCYEESVFDADEEWEAVADLRVRFVHDGGRILANVAGIFAGLAADRDAGPA